MARIEATTQGLDIRYVVTYAAWLGASISTGRSIANAVQAENLIKLHKAQLASDRTSCHSPTANQVRLVLHTAAYWLMLMLRDAIPAASPLAKAEFVTIRIKLIKIAARVIEHAARIRIHLPAGCPEQFCFTRTAVASRKPFRNCWGERPSTHPETRQRVAARFVIAPGRLPRRASYVRPAALRLTASSCMDRASFGVEKQVLLASYTSALG